MGFGLTTISHRRLLAGPLDTIPTVVPCPRPTLARRLPLLTDTVYLLPPHAAAIRKAKERSMLKILFLLLGRALQLTLGILATRFHSYSTAVAALSVLIRVPVIFGLVSQLLLSSCCAVSHSQCAVDRR